ncbi:MAG: hypothetical protein AAGF11_18910 [Myxococcota bacterium]
MKTKRIDTPAVDYEKDAARWAEVGRPDHAANLYAIVLDLDPDNWDARLQRAACLARSERPKAAAEAYVEIARNYVRRGSRHEAVAVGHRILQLDVLTFCCDNMTDIVHAIGIEAAPLCRSAARLHRKKGRDDEAADLLRLCAELAPREVEPWRELAQLYVDHHMLPEAARALRHAGQRLVSANEDEKYVEFARTILWMEPHDLETLRELPRALLRMGEPQRAVVELSTLLRVSPGDVVGYETLANAFAAIGRGSVCVSVLQQLTTNLTTSGRRAEAEAILERARAWRPGDRQFVRQVIGLRDMQPSGPIRVDDARPTTEEGTVVLSIADLTQEAQTLDPDDTEDSVIDATDIAELETVELVDREDSVVLRLSDLSRVKRPATAPVPVAREPLAYGQQSIPGNTQILDLRDIKEIQAGGGTGEGASSAARREQEAKAKRGETIVGVVVPRRWIRTQRSSK